MRVSPLGTQGDKHHEAACDIGECAGLWGRLPWGGGQGLSLGHPDPVCAWSATLGGLGAESECPDELTQARIADRVQGKGC